MKPEVVIKYEKQPPTETKITESYAVPGPLKIVSAPSPKAPFSRKTAPTASNENKKKVSENSNSGSSSRTAFKMPSAAELGKSIKKLKNTAGINIDAEGNFINLNPKTKNESKFTLEWMEQIRKREETSRNKLATAKSEPNPVIAVSAETITAKAA